MKKLITILLVATLMSNVATGVFANDLNNSDENEVLLSEAEDNNVAGEFSSETILNSGENGGTEWIIYDNGTAVIRTRPNSNNRMQSGKQSDDLIAFTGEIIVEKDVKLPSDSRNLFEGFKASSIIFKNDTSNVTKMAYMFKGASNLTNLDLSSFDTSNVTSLTGMFEGVSSLTSLDLSSFNTGKVTEMAQLFFGASSLTSLDVSSFDVSKVITMEMMFQDVSSLQLVDLSSFETTSLVYAGNMFYGASSLISLDLSGFDTSETPWMRQMFRDVNNLKELKLSETSIFSLSMGASTIFEAPYNGKWVQQDDRSIGGKDLQDLLAKYDGSKPGTYVMDRTFTVGFNYDSNRDEVLVSYNDIIDKLQVPVPTKIGYDFVEWNTKIDGSGDVYNPETPVLDDIEVYAIFEESVYTVTFDVDGIITYTNVNYDELINADEIPDTTKDGFKFIGWVLVDGENETSFNPNEHTVTNNILLRAVYEENNDQAMTPIIPSLPMPDEEGDDKEMTPIEPSLPMPDDEGDDKEMTPIEPSEPNPDYEGEDKVMLPLEPSLPNDEIDEEGSSDSIVSPDKENNKLPDTGVNNSYLWLIVLAVSVLTVFKLKKEEEQIN